MNKELLDLATWTMEAAQSAGAAAAAVAITGSRRVQVSYRERRPENISEAATRDMSVRLYVNGRYSLQRTSDLRRDALKEFVDNAVAMTRLLAEDPDHSLPDSAYQAGRSTADLAIVDPSHAVLTPGQRHEFVRAAEEACLERGGDRVISATAGFQDSRNESVLVMSNGFSGHHEATFFSGNAGLSVQDEGDRRPSSGVWAAAVRRQVLPAPEELGVAAAERALGMLGAVKLPTQTLPVIVENRVALRFIMGLLQALSARAVYLKQSFLAEHRNQRIGSPVLTLVDDPLLPGGLASRHFDGEGLSARRRTIVEAGILKEFFVDWFYSRKLGWEPTSGGPSNLLMPPGQRSVEEIMADLGRGLLIRDFIGGNVNSTTGDMSIGIQGHLFEEGVPVQAFSEMNVAGNLLDLLQRLDEAGNDPWPYSSYRLPSLVFADVVVSGA